MVKMLRVNMAILVVGCSAQPTTRSIEYMTNLEKYVATSKRPNWAKIKNFDESFVGKNAKDFSIDIKNDEGAVVYIFSCKDLSDSGKELNCEINLSNVSFSENRSLIRDFFTNYDKNQFSQVSLRKKCDKFEKNYVFRSIKISVSFCKDNNFGFKSVIKAENDYSLFSKSSSVMPISYCSNFGNDEKNKCYARLPVPECQDTISFKRKACSFDSFVNLSPWESK